MRKGVTLLELIIVVIVIGILASIALPIFSKARERSLDKEAIANLKLIQAAERIYRMEWGAYYPPSGSQGVASINNFLKLALPGASAWVVTVDSNAQGTAQRPGGGRSWTLPVTGTDPTCSGGSGSGACP